MSGEVKVTITVRGLRDPGTAEQGIVNMLKRALFLVESVPGELGARIDGSSGSIELDGNREWRRAEQSKPTAGRPRTR